MVWGVEELTVEQRYKKAIEAGIDQFGGDHTPEIIVESGPDRARLPRPGSTNRSGACWATSSSSDCSRTPTSIRSRRGRSSAAPNSRLPRTGHSARRSCCSRIRGREGGKTLPLKPGTKIYVEGIDRDHRRRVRHGGRQPGRRRTWPSCACKHRSRLAPVSLGGFTRATSLSREKRCEHLQEVMQTKPTVIDVYLDRPAVMPGAGSKAAAALLGSFGASDQALLDVVFGRFVPTGKLPFELPSLDGGGGATKGRRAS